MKRARWTVVGMVFVWFAGSAVPSIAAPGIARSVCASTPAAALIAAKGASSMNAPALAEAHGYRVESVRWDPLQRQSWAVIESCDHRDRPSVMMLMEGATPPARIATPLPVSAPIVRAGDLIHLWKSTSYAHIEMVAISEENGAIGARIRVRLATPRDGEVTQPQYLAGVVRGPADVEIEP